MAATSSISRLSLAFTAVTPATACTARTSAATWLRRSSRPVRFPSKLVLPMRWEPSGWLLPTLDGELEVGALGRHRTQLALSGNYEPPLGTVGRTVDRLALHRIAEATIKDFLDRVGAVVSTAPYSPEGRDHRPPVPGRSPADRPQTSG